MNWFRHRANKWSYGKYTLRRHHKYPYGWSAFDKNERAFARGSFNEMKILVEITAKLES